MKQKRNARRLAIAIALLCAAASLKVVASPQVRRPVAKFIQFYEQNQVLPDSQDMSLWDRVLLSLLMTKTASS